jgi:hypothetical protein
VFRAVKVYRNRSISVYSFRLAWRYKYFIIIKTKKDSYIEKALKLELETEING